MSVPDAVLARYRRLQEVLARPGAGVAPGWREAGAVLEAAGAVLRRQEHLGPPHGVDAALRGLPRETVQAWLGALHEREVDAALTRAGEEGLEAGLGEERGEAEVLAARVMEALRARDALQSQAAALARWELLAGEEAGPLLRRLVERLQALDASHRARAHLLVGANPLRRAERDALDLAERAQAWWFSARAECDGLLAALAGRREALGSHLDCCLECLEDLESTRAVEAPLPSHLDADALWALDLGSATPGERAHWTAHAARCPACAGALEALAVGDAAIAEVLAEEEVALRQAARTLEAPGRSAPAARRPEREVLEARREFRLLLMRERGALRLLVQPMRLSAVASALVFLPPGRSPLRPRTTPEGLDFALGEEGALRRRVVAVRLTLAGTGEVYQREFPL